MAKVWVDGEVINATKLNDYAEEIVEGVSPTVTTSKSGGVTTITITDIEGTHTATVNDGTNGTDGTDGVSPTVSISKTGKTTTITITDAQGTHTATILDGNDGTGTGDMLKATYDPDNKSSQIATETELETHTGDTTVHVTSAEKTTWNGKQDALPSITNDRYLHTNSSTGALEWSSVDLSGKEDKGYVTIGGTQYQIRTGTSGASGYITIETE